MRLLLFVLLAAAASAQDPDPNPAWTYDPVAVGHVRSYAQGLTAESTTYWRTDSPTSLTLDGERWGVRRTQRFFRLDGNAEGWGRTEDRVLVRFDTTEANVFVRAADGSARPLYPCRLDIPLAPAGGRCGDDVPYTKTDSRLVFQDRGNGFSTTLQSGIGVVGGATDRSPGFELVGAVIGGQTLLSEPDAFPDSSIDPTPASRYAPMSVGDEWQYEWSQGAAGPGRPEYRRVTVGEEREIEGRTYFGFSAGTLVQGDWVGATATTYARFDTLAARVVGPDGRDPLGPVRVGACPFDEPASSPGGDTVYCETVEQSPEAVALTARGAVRVRAETIDAPLREYLYAGIADYPCGQGVHAAGIGYVGYECSGSAPGAYERLIFARVRQPDGSILELGQRYAVSTDGAPDANRLALTVGPNPTAGPLTLRLATPVGGAVRWRAFDALGRTVWQRDEVRPQGDAVLSLDASDWPAGLYVVRAATASGAVTATAVRR